MNLIFIVLPWHVFPGSGPLLRCSAISVGDLIPPVHSTDSCLIRRTMQCFCARVHQTKIFLLTRCNIRCKAQPLCELSKQKWCKQYSGTLSLVESVHKQCQYTKRTLQCWPSWRGAHKETNSGKQSLVCSHAAQHWKAGGDQLFDSIFHSTFACHTL